MNDLKKQFRKVIIKGSKYKSDFCHYFREIELLELLIFFKLKFFSVEIFFFLNQKFFFWRQNFIRSKKKILIKKFK